MMSMKLRDIAILRIKSADCRCIISDISKEWGHELEAKCWFDRQKWNIIKHKKYINI